MIRQKGLLPEPLMLDAMEFMAGATALPDEERRPYLDAALAHARRDDLAGFEPGTALWLRQIAEHVDRNGPEPAYWPLYERPEARE